MAIKLDLEKAYDRLDWDFIQDTLHDMRLPQPLVDTIMRCISTSSMRILWNGEPTDQFYPKRGIRQGDSLSPYIFVACIERLNQLIMRKVHGDRWIPVQVCRGGPKISSLFFADDVVRFAKATREQALLVRACLDRFCQASRQRISVSKSRVYFSPNTKEDVIEEICTSLDMERTADLGKYLGVPIINGKVTRVTFHEMLHRVTNDLWGGRRSVFPWLVEPL